MLHERISLSQLILAVLIRVLQGILRMYSLISTLWNATNLLGIVTSYSVKHTNVVLKYPFGRSKLSEFIITDRTCDLSCTVWSEVVENNGIVFF